MSTFPHGSDQSAAAMVRGTAAAIAVTGQERFTVLGRYAFRWCQHELVELIDLETGECRELLRCAGGLSGDLRRRNCHWNGYRVLRLRSRRAQGQALAGSCP